MAETLAVKKATFHAQIRKLDDRRLLERVFQNLALEVPVGVKHSLLAARVIRRHFSATLLAKNVLISQTVAAIRMSTQTSWVNQTSKKENQKSFVFYRLKPAPAAEDSCDNSQTSLIFLGARVGPLPLECAPTTQTHLPQDFAQCA